jgi:hypothetical protein
VFFLQMFRRGFANATHALLCKSLWQKLENMKIEPNDTHLPWRLIGRAVM